MEYMQGYQFMPGDPRLVEHIVYELKSHGIFDQFRKDCLADVDTKPAYQNLRQRVEGQVSVFLNSQKWKPEMNKNQLREKLRKSMQESGFLETGVERIVDQVVNPKISTVFLPQVEEMVYKYLGLEKPHKIEDEKINGSDKLEICTDLLPTDLEAISPDSVTSSKHIHNITVEEFSPKLNENEDAIVKDIKNDEYESPPFEPIVNKSEFCNENSNDSHLSGISGLTSQGSLSPKPNNTEIDTTNHDSHLSRVSSGSQVSGVANSNAVSNTDDSIIKSKSKNADGEKKNGEDMTDKPNSMENNIELKMDVDSSMSCDSDAKGLVIITESSNEAVEGKTVIIDNSIEIKISKEVEMNEKNNEYQNNEISSINSPIKSDKNKSHSSKKRDSSSHTHSDKHHSSSHHHKSKHRHHDRSDEKRDRAEHDKEKSKKYKKSRESKVEKDSSKKSYHSSKDRREKDKHDSDSKHNSSEKHHNGKSKSPRNDSSRSRSSGHSKSSKKNSDEHSTSEPNVKDQKVDKDKSRKKSKSQDDHGSAKNQKSGYRRSTDRDSNDGSGAGLKKHSSSSSHLIPSGNKQKENTAENMQSSGSSNETSDNTNAKTKDTSSQKSQNFQESCKSTSVLEIRKPKIASNIYEARKLIKVRRKMEKQAQKRRLRELKSKLSEESSDVEKTPNKLCENDDKKALVTEKDDVNAKENNLSDGSQFFGFTNNHKVFYDLDMSSNSDEMEAGLKENLSASSGNEFEENQEIKQRSKAEIMEIIFGRDLSLPNQDGDNKTIENGSFQVSYCSDYDNEESDDSKMPQKSDQENCVNNNVHKKRKLNDSSKIQCLDIDTRKVSKKNHLNIVDQSKLSNIFKKSDTNISNAEGNNEDILINKTPKSRSSIYHTQCYTNEDLYKPRPSFGSSRRRKVSAL